MVSSLYISITVQTYTKLLMFYTSRQLMRKFYGHRHRIYSSTYDSSRIKSSFIFHTGLWLDLKLYFAPTGDVKFNSVEPYTKNRLSALPFADIIRDYKVISDGVVPENPLKFLYPDIPKDEAFGRLYNSQPSKGKSTIQFHHLEFSVLVLDLCRLTRL